MSKNLAPLQNKDKLAVRGGADRGSLGTDVYPHNDIYSGNGRLPINHPNYNKSYRHYNPNNPEFIDNGGGENGFHSDPHNLYEGGIFSGGAELGANDLRNDRSHYITNLFNDSQRIIPGEKS